jgi:hypothetical protein
MSRGNLLITQEWERESLNWIAAEVRGRGFNTNDVGMLQLSCEYSGIIGQQLAHKLSCGEKPMNIEPVNIPYNGEFEVVIHPDVLDRHRRWLVVDSGCLTGRNFRSVETILLNYGVPRDQMLFCCIACTFQAAFVPDICPVRFDAKSQAVHFWWECGTQAFGAGV